MAGLYVEQFEIGSVFEHEIRRTVTEADNVWFCAATFNPARIHIDAEYCTATAFGKPLVNPRARVSAVFMKSDTVGTYGFLDQ